MTGEPADHPRLVPVAAATSISQADILRAVLEDAGIPAFIPNENASVVLCHISLAVNPDGILVLVRDEDEQAAREVLKLPAGSDGPPQREPAAARETTADEYARMAARSAVFTWLFPPLAVWTVYCIGRAYAVRRQRPPMAPERFDRNILCAVLFGVAIALVIGFVYWQMLSRL